jgi:N-acetylglutamate synthase-like GNAT family acetyltransferase
MLLKNMPRIRVMQREDIQEAVRLTSLEEWRFTESDFKAMLQLWPDGNFVMEGDNNEVIGIGSVLSYGKIAYLSNYIVIKNERGKGYGKALVLKSLEYIKQNEIQETLLYTYDDRTEFYSQFGFKEVCAATAYTGIPKSSFASEGISMIKAEDLGELKAYDSNSFGIDRSRFIDKLHEYFRDNFIVARKHGEICGYVTAGSCPGGILEVGQWIANDVEIAQGLISMLLKKAKPSSVYIIVPDSNQSARKIMSACNLKPGRKYVKMRMGVILSFPKTDYMYSLCTMEVW